MLEVYLTNLGKYNEGVLAGRWVRLPCGEDELNAALCSIGIDGVRYEEWFISSTVSDIDGLSELIGEYDDLEPLNELTEKLDALHGYELDKVEAILEYDIATVSDLLRILNDGLDNYVFFKDVHDDEDLGRCLIEDYCTLNVPDELIYYIDYEAFGRDCRLEEGGSFTSYGYVASVA